MEKTKNINTLKGRYDTVCEHITWCIENEIELSNKPAKEAKLLIDNLFDQQLKRINDMKQTHYSELIKLYKLSLSDELQEQELKQVLKEAVLEKEGNIEAAIKKYESNIFDGCYQARHSFDRLIILYRKEKDYNNEIRVIKRAIEVFPGETKYTERLQKINTLLL